MRSLFSLFTILVSISFISASSALAGEQPQGQSMPVPWGSVHEMNSEFLDFQEGSPLQVIAIQIGRLDLLNAVVVVNISERTIVKYQLGWVVTDRDNPRPGTVFEGIPTDTMLRPWETHEAGRQGANFSTVLEDLNSRGIQFGKVTVGVTYVKFEDGTEWSYVLRGRREFLSGQATLQYRLNLEPILKKRRLERASKNSSNATTGLGQASLWARLLARVRGYFSPWIVRACGSCWAPVCNPGNRQCWNDGCNCFNVGMTDATVLRSFVHWRGAICRIARPFLGLAIPETHAVSAA
jgi:hypothetical protein